MIRALLTAATAGAIAAAAIGVAPVVSADPLDACTEWNANRTACVYANCTEAKANGRCDIRQGESDYCPKQDRDSDGIACEC